MLSFFVANAFAQQPTIPVADNLVAENIPNLPTTIVEETKPYTEFRGASFIGWHPLKKEVLISTRFGNSAQLHYVKGPGLDRKQLTFFSEPIAEAIFEPIKGTYFLFLKDNGGNEFSQLYRYDLATNKSTLITDGKRSQNGGIHWNNKGDKIAYASTQRNGADRDIYIMNPLDPTSNKLASENKGGEWGVVDWFQDDAKLVIEEVISVNESRLYILDATGTKTRLLPETDERATYNGVAIKKDGRGIYLITNKDSEFNRLAYFDFASKKLNFISASIPWDIEEATLSKDGNQLAFMANENGVSKLFLLSTTTNTFVPVSNSPIGVLDNIKWTGDSKSLGFTLSGYQTPADVYEYNTQTKTFIRYTESELGGMDISSLQEPQLVSWKSFDGKTITGFMYKASSKFSGKRPVMINIHGGPEGQYRPIFLGRNNYYLNELGITIIYPNVRGSTGYGKTFLDADNGLNRLDSPKDIGALIDWIATQPDLDKDKIMILGGSYGGFMTLATSYMYSDKIKCSMAIVGISHFSTFLKNTEDYRRDLRRVEYGDERDPKMAAFFETMAPLNHTAEIKKPIFIVQGQNDPRVPATEAIQMKDKIKGNGGTVWFLMAKDEGHGFKKKNNVDFHFYSTVAFVKEYLLK
jgi:dipeptidyl aminopeptidase/acylaminoacyl peptidase